MEHKRVNPTRTNERLRHEMSPTRWLHNKCSSKSCPPPSRQESLVIRVAEIPISWRLEMQMGKLKVLMDLFQKGPKEERSIGKHKLRIVRELFVADMDWMEPPNSY